MASDSAEPYSQHVEPPIDNDLLQTYIRVAKNDALRARLGKQGAPNTKETKSVYDSAKILQIDSGVLDELRSELEARDRQIMASLSLTVENSLKTAAVYFLQCQGAYQEGRELPSPRTAQQASSQRDFEKTSQLSKHPTQPAEVTVNDDEIKPRVPDTQAPGVDTSRGVVTDSLNADSKPDKSNEFAQVKSDACNWHSFQRAMKGSGHKHSRLYKEFVSLSGPKKSIWHELFHACGLSSCLATQQPSGPMASLIYHSCFAFISGLLVMANTALVGYETDISIKLALRLPGAHEVAWMDTCNWVFNIIFTAEVLFKMVVLGSWYFVSPDDWAWNLFDLVVVITSLLSELTKGLNLSFLRSFRMLRAVRAARLIRVLRAFRELRKMLLAMLASVKSILWVFLFLATIMFMVAVLLLQGLAHALGDMDVISAEHDEAVTSIEEWYGSMGLAWLSLLRAFSGGADWYSICIPLQTAGPMYQVVLVLFILFVNIGIMNVLTGVFLSNAADSSDRDLVIQDYKVKVEGFVQMMLDLFTELDLDREGDVDWQTFERAIEHDVVQAYLAANGLEPLHARLIFDLLDEKQVGKINLLDFVMGMMNLKGNATSVDARVIMKEIGMIPEIVGSSFGMNAK